MSQASKSKVRTQDQASLDVLLVCGAPGSGKSTLAAAIRDDLGAVIEVDTLRGMVTRCDWTDKATHGAALGMAIDGAVRMAASGTRPVAVVDTFAWGRLGWAQAQLSRAGLRHSTVLLWVREAELCWRLAGRDSGYRHAGPALALNAEAMTQRGHGVVSIDTTDLDAAGVAAAVRARLSSAAALDDSHAKKQRAPSRNQLHPVHR